eukprot:4204281-Prymnesium_polylepis.1
MPHVGRRRASGNPTNTHTPVMRVPDLGLALRVCPGMTHSSGADSQLLGPRDFSLPLAGVTARTSAACAPSNMRVDG